MDRRENVSSNFKPLFQGGLLPRSASCLWDICCLLTRKPPGGRAGLTTPLSTCHIHASPRAQWLFINWWNDRLLLSHQFSRESEHRQCYGLNRVPPQIHLLRCWRPVTQNVAIFGDGPVKRWLKGNEAVWMGSSSSRTGVFIRGDSSQTHAQRMTWGEDGHIRAKERGLLRNQFCRHLDLGLPALEL